jgi:hypothetical protein
MIFQYYEINTSVSEVFHHFGGGYSSMYMKVYPLRLWSGYMISGGPDDKSFLADLYGLSYDYWYTLSESRSEASWNKYWKRVKENITNDIPVITITNYNDLNNVPNEMYYPDWMVIVGFNESNETVCCHIPYNGAYLYYPKEVVKNAVFTIYLNDRISRVIYSIDIFKNTSKLPLSKEECFQKAHERNIKRMRGEKSAYDKEVYQNIFHMRIFGINALKCLKNDVNLFNLLLYKKLPAIHFLSPWTSFAGYYMIFEEKYEIAQYLYENKELSPYICQWNAQHLELEADLILHLTHQFVKLNETLSGNNFLSNLIMARSIIKEIKSTIDVLISIEKVIIEE